MRSSVPRVLHFCLSPLALLLAPFLQPRPDRVAYAAEDGEPLVEVAGRGGGVFEAPVDALGAGGEDGATLARVVADRDDDIELAPRELVHRLRAVARDVHP